MKKKLCLLAATILVISCLVLAGCGSDSQKSYANKPNDGHMHSYIHNVKTDEYICRLCGMEYPGDPSELVRVD